MDDKAAPEMTPTELIDGRIQELNDWRSSRQTRSDGTA